MNTVKILFCIFLMIPFMGGCNFKLGSSSEEKVEYTNPRTEPSQIADEYHLTEIKGVAYCAQLSADQNDVRCVEADLDSIPSPFSEYITNPIRFIYHLTSGDGFLAAPDSERGLGVKIKSYADKTFGQRAAFEPFAFWKAIDGETCEATEAFAWDGQAHPGLASGTVAGKPISGRISLEVLGLFSYGSTCGKQFEEIKTCLTDVNQCPSDASNSQRAYYNYARSWFGPWLDSGALTLEELEEHKILGFSLLYE